MKEVVIAGYLRTAQSRSRPRDPARDWFCKMRGDELLAKLLPELIQRVGIDPKDIEEVVIRHPNVSEVAVIGVPDEKWGEVPVAAVVLMPDTTLDPQELITWTNKRVDAKFQRIRDVIIMTSFPRNVAGKMLKREMRNAYKRSDNRTP